MTQAAPTKSKQKKDARDIRAEAMKIANSIKTDGQTPAETKAIANGIQRGMEMFLRQHSEKTRDLDKRVKKVKQLANQSSQAKPVGETEQTITAPKQSLLPWILLALSWSLFLLLEAARILL